MKRIDREVASSRASARTASMVSSTWSTDPGIARSWSSTAETSSANLTPRA